MSGAKGERKKGRTRGWVGRAALVCPKEEKGASGVCMPAHNRNWTPESRRRHPRTPARSQGAGAAACRCPCSGSLATQAAGLILPGR